MNKKRLLREGQELSPLETLKSAKVYLQDLPLGNCWKDRGCSICDALRILNAAMALLRQNSKTE